MTAPVVREVDSPRSLRWVAARMLATTCRRYLDGKFRFILFFLVRLAVLWIVAFEVGWIAAVVVLCIMLVASQARIAIRLVRARVWEVTQAETSKVCAWAVVRPHPLDRDTWQLDIVQHPWRQRDMHWVPFLMGAVHRAADTYGVAVQSVDDADTRLLLRFGYLKTVTPISPIPFLLRPFPGKATTGGIARPEPLATAYEHVIGRPEDANAVRELITQILSAAVSIQAGRERFGWHAYVLRRDAPAWLLARACALCLDSHIEGLARDRVAAANRTDETAQEGQQIDAVIVCLLTTVELVRLAIERSTMVALTAGWQRLPWSENLATLELDALALTGLTATGRRRSGAALGLLDTESSTSVHAAALLVRDRAKGARQWSRFDGEDVSAWASAVAYDALELCRNRFATRGLRRAITRLAEQSLRQLSFLLLPMSPTASQEGDQKDVEEYWRAYLRRGTAPEHPPSKLVPLSATQLGRIGMIRGAEGPRAKQFKRTLLEIFTTFVTILVIGTLAWVLTVTALHPGLLYEELFDYLALTITGKEWIPGSSTPGGSWNLGVESELLKDSTIGLLAVVVTATVAVAVARPRESSIKAWSQDRAWQVFVVAVGYIASIAAIVLAISPLPLWPVLNLTQKAHAVSAVMFALLSAASAASLSVVQSRLDEWQQRRRLLLAQARLQRAHARLGPSPHPGLLVLGGLGTALLSTAHLLALNLLLLISTDDWSLFDFAEFMAVMATLNLPPIIALTVLCVARWLSAWNLAGRVTITVGVLAGFALVLMAAPISVWIAYDADYSASQLMIIAVVAMSPSLIFLIFLLVARRRSFRTQRRTGPGTFALHIALRIGRSNFQRASE